jgi:hypothetical protein
MENRPKIPEDIKRIVRARCGYGCVMCGAQPYDYDHIEEYEIVKCHEANNLTLLCKHHHGEKTLNNLPRAEVERANLDPYYLKIETTKSRFLYYSGDSVEVHIGGNIFKYQNIPNGYIFIPLQIDDLNIISFKREDDKLLFSFVSFDRSNHKIVEIIDNEISHSTSIWDAEWTSNKLTLRCANGIYLLRMLFETPNIIKIDKGFFHYNMTDILLDDDAIFIANNKALLRNNMSTNCTIGLCISGHGNYIESWKEIKALFKKSKKSIKTTRRLD